MTGIILFAHGSRVEAANTAVLNVAAEVARKGRFPLVEAAFLDCAAPELGEAVRRLVSKGASEILIVPYFLTLGTHMDRDLPRMVEELSAVHADVSFRVTPPLDGHPALTGMVMDRIREALE